MTDPLLREIVNALSGDRMTFLSPPGGEGSVMRFRGNLPAGVIGAPLHYHAEMRERFTVEQGELRIDLVGGQSRILTAGESADIAPGMHHGFRNASNREVQYVVTADPGAQLERFLRTMTALTNDGRTWRGGMPRNPLALAAALNEVDMVLVGPPVLVQRALIRSLAVLASVLGLRNPLA